MATYLMRFSYTPETWSKLIQNPEDRRDAARAYAEQVRRTPRLLVRVRRVRRLRDHRGARQRVDGRARACDHGRWGSRVGRSTVLMTVEETLEALAKGKGIGYRKPGDPHAN